MAAKNKASYEERLAAARYCLDENHTVQETAAEFKRTPQTIKKWTETYQMLGAEGLEDRSHLSPAERKIREEADEAKRTALLKLQLEQLRDQELELQKEIIMLKVEQGRKLSPEEENYVKK